MCKHLNNHPDISQVLVEQDMGTLHMEEPLRAEDPATTGTPAVAAEGSQAVALEATASHTEEEEDHPVDLHLQAHQTTPAIRMATGVARSHGIVVEARLSQLGRGMGRAFTSSKWKRTSRSGLGLRSGNTGIGLHL